MTEQQMQYKLGQFFSTWFDIEYEVWSVDHTKRIDMVMVHKSDIEKKYPFGVEIKIFETKKGKDIADWIKQAYIYSTKKFTGYGKLIIFIFPRISFRYLNEGDEMNKHPKTSIDHNVTTMLGQFGIGEIIPDEYDNKRIVYSGQVFWNEYRNDLRTHNIDRLWKEK